ncbi:Filament-like plant protein 7 [Vitis vinifera]|uniref:Filament-like plant protein 7 n=1 Tax=Vitis vinifera TaxID=29760 RepID=A0A438FKL8_VITVI|nr:Filament-like plant protein 7 [Vitis vinifera]
MDQKTWLWRKKSTEKNIVAADKVNVPLKGNEEEIQTLLADKAELERDLKSLNDKLSSAVSEHNVKDDLVKKHAKTAQEAITGWERAKAEVVTLKQELDEALRQRVAGEERLTHLDAALKECMQQLRFVREEQEQRIHDAVMKTAREFEKTQMVLEEKLAETSKRLAKLGAENTHLSKALLAKEKLIGDLSDRRKQTEADFNALMTRLDSTEKDHASLKYEVRVLEKELEIRNEEREFNRRTADASHKQHLESVKKIAKLESECQRLRLLVRKRLPGPAALAKMKNEVEMLGRDPSEMRRRKSSSSPTGLMVDSVAYNSLDTPSKSTNFLTEQLCSMEEENKTLKEALVKKQMNSNFRESCTLAQPPNSHKMSDDKVSCAESWASSLISELEHFKNGKHNQTPSRKTVRVSDINLMDDFVEMEKLAIVSVNKPLGNLHPSSQEADTAIGTMDKESASSESKGREIVPVSGSQSAFSFSNQEIQSENILIGKVPGWLQDILKVILEQIHVSQRNPDEIIEDIRVAMAHINHLNTGVDNSSSETSNQKLQSDLSKSICKMVELIEGISLPSLDYDTQETFSRKDGSFFPHKNSETPTGYVVRVFQWKTSELRSVLNQFVHSCDDLLNGKADLEKFARELTSALDWIMNHCFSLQDVSSMKDAIKKQFDWDESRSENEVEIGTSSQFSEVNNLCLPREHLSCLPAGRAPNSHNDFFQTEEVLSNMREENQRLKDELMDMKSGKKNLGRRLRPAIDQSESLMVQLQESEKTIASLKKELEMLKESKRMIEDQSEHHKFMNEDLDTQLTVSRAELNEALQKLSSLEVELESRNNCCEDLEATCLELQLQLDRITKKETPNHDMDQEENQLRTDWEITAASEKLAECQETILNLGKQLKALASPIEASLVDNVISTPSDTITTTATVTTTSIATNKNMSQRSSLLDRMLAEDDAETKDPKSPKTKESNRTLDPQKSPTRLHANTKPTFSPNGTLELPKKFVSLNGIKSDADDTAVGSLAILPSKKWSSGGLLRKLLWGRKKGNSKKMALSVAA